SSGLQTLPSASRWNSGGVATARGALPAMLARTVRPFIQSTATGNAYSFAFMASGSPEATAGASANSPSRGRKRTPRPARARAVQALVPYRRGGGAPARARRAGRRVPRGRASCGGLRAFASTRRAPARWRRARRASRRRRWHRRPPRLARGRPRARRRGRRASAHGRASPPRRGPPLPSDGRGSRGRARGSATAASGDGSGQDVRARAAPAASRARPARGRTPCASVALPPARRSSRQAGADVQLDAGSAKEPREGAPRVGLLERELQAGVVEPVRRDHRVDVRRDDLVTAVDLVHDDAARDLETSGRRAGLRELARKGHGDAAAVRGGEQLLRARLPLRPADARRKREPETVEGACAGRDRARAAGDVALPGQVCASLDARHQAAETTAGVPSG